jgi:ADP-ribose pyrophosphatase YjhB (NUDIX family)
MRSATPSMAMLAGSDKVISTVPAAARLVFRWLARCVVRILPGGRRKLLNPMEQLTVTVGRRAARAILIDDQARLVLIKRTKPEQAPYWTAPGGGVDDTDASVEAALHRELAEELGAEASGATRVFLVSSASESGVAVQYFFVARLTKLDESARTGPEFEDSSRGGYVLDRVDLRGDDLASVDLKPVALKEFILANREALLAEVATGLARDQEVPHRR